MHQCPKAILFDMDGTLTRPMLDFPAIKREMGIGTELILEALARMPPAQRKRAEAVLHRHEREAAERSMLNEGCGQLLDWLRRAGVKIALVTRNSRISAVTVLAPPLLEMDAVITREDGLFKPDPAPLLLACKRLGVGIAESWMVGDGQYDIEAGAAAGMPTVWVSHGLDRPFTAEPWRVVTALPEIIPLLQGSIGDQLPLTERVLPGGVSWMEVYVVKWIVGLACMLSLVATSVRGEPLPANASADQVLDALDAVGKELHDFTAHVDMTEADYTLMDIATQGGMVWYQRLGENNGRIRVLFETRTVDDETALEKYEYRLEDGKLVDRDYQKKIEVTRQVLRPGETINLLKLGEGPFPLPIGQDKEAVHRVFDVRIGDAGKEPDPAGTIHIVLKPKPDSQFAGKFFEMHVWVDEQTHMPAKLEIYRDEAGARVQSTVFKDLQTNVGLGDKEFALPKIDEKEWSLHEEPFSE